MKATATNAPDPSSRFDFNALRILAVREETCPETELEIARFNHMGSLIGDCAADLCNLMNNILTLDEQEAFGVVLIGITERLRDGGSPLPTPYELQAVRKLMAAFTLKAPMGSPSAN